MARGDRCKNSAGRPLRLVLASASPRRRQLLADAGYDFEVAPSIIAEPESTDSHVGAAAFAEALSFLKASSVAEGREDALVIGADTVVALHGKLYGKPADVYDALRILSALMVETHDVITGVTFIDTRAERRAITHDLTRVTMTPMTAEQLDAYLESGLWRGKAGAYGIQDHDDQFVRQLEGDFSNVVGLPLKLVEETLTRWGHPPLSH